MRNNVGRTEGDGLFDSMYAQWGQALQPWILPLAGIGIVLTPLGIALVAWSGRRRFSRRNFAGVEEFSSYGHSVGSRIIEGLVDRLGAVVLLFGLLAVFGAGYAWFLQRY